MNANSRNTIAVRYYILALNLFVITMFFLLETLGGSGSGLFLLLTATLSSFLSLVLVILHRWSWAKWLMISNLMLLIGGAVANFVFR